jgi:hypothetical protein
MVSCLSGKSYHFVSDVLKANRQGTCRRRPGYLYNEWRMARIQSNSSQLGQPKDPNWSYTYRRSTHGRRRWWSTIRSTTIHASSDITTFPPSTSTSHDGSFWNRSLTNGSSSSTSRILLSSPNFILRCCRCSNS